MADIATLGIRVTSNGINDAHRGLRDLEQQGARTERATDSVSRSFGDLKSAIATLGIAAAVRQFVKAADEMQNIESRIRLVTKSSAELAQVQSELFRRSQESQTSLRANSELYISMARATDGLNLSQSRLIGLTDGISKAFVVSGAGAQETAGAIRQLGQALQSGALRGDEFNAIAENAPRLMKAMADGMGIARREMRSLAEAGQLTTERILPALEKGLQKVDAEFAQMPQTVSRATTELSNSFDKWASDTNNQIGLNAALANGISGLARNFDLLADAAALTAGVVAGKYLGSIVTATQAKIAEAAATMRAMQAEAQALIVKKEFTAMLLAEAQASAAAATGMQRLAITQSQVIPLQQRLTAATAAATAAQAAAVPGMTLARGAMAALGGPIGLVTTALTLGATAWLMWGNKTDEATAKVEDLATKRIDGVIEKLDMLNAGLERTSRTVYSQTIQSAESELKTVNAEVSYLKNLLDQMDTKGGRGRFSDEGKAMQDRLSQFVQKQIQLENELAYARENASRVGAQSLDDYVNKFATAEQKLAKSRDEIVRGYLEVIKQTSVDGVFDQNNAAHVAALKQMNAAVDELGKKGKTSAATVRDLHDASDDYAKHLRDKLTKDLAAAAKAQDDLTKRYAEALGPLEEYALELENQLATYGMTEAQIAATTLARYEEVRALAAQNGASESYLAQLDREIDARRRIAEASAGIDVLKQNEEAKDSFEDLKQAIEGWGKDSAKAIVDFAMTGKTSFTEMVNSMIADMARMVVQQKITGPLAQAVSSFDWGGLASSFFGGSPASPAMVSRGGGFSPSMHSGGIVGSGEGSGMRFVPPAVFEGAPRYHFGGIAGDEVPTILQRGEGVFTRGQMAALGQMAAPSVNVEIINNTGAQVQQSEVADSRGGRKMQIVIGDAVAGEMRRPGSSINSATRQTFGLSPVLAGR